MHLDKSCRYLICTSVLVSNAAVKKNNNFHRFSLETRETAIRIEQRAQLNSNGSLVKHRKWPQECGVPLKAKSIPPLLIPTVHNKFDELTV